MIGAVLDDRAVERIGQIEHAFAFLATQRLAGRIGEIGRQVEELHPPALLLRRRRIVGGRAVSHGVQPVVVGFVGGKGLQGAKIGRPRDERRIALGQVELAEIVERLLRAGGDDDVVEPAGNAELVHLRRDPRAQPLVPLGRRILQRGPAGPLPQRLGIGGGEGIGGKKLGVGNAPANEMMSG